MSVIRPVDLSNQFIPDKLLQSFRAQKDKLSWHSVDETQVELKFLEFKVMAHAFRPFLFFFILKLSSGHYDCSLLSVLQLSQLLLADFFGFFEALNCKNFLS